jgi:hypothetical protein
MKMQPAIASRMIKNILLSILIYALPVLLMLFSFYLSGERPWISHQKENISNESKH